MTRNVLTITSITMIVFFLAGAATVWLGTQATNELAGLGSAMYGVIIMLAGLLIGLLGITLTLRAQAK